MPISDLLASISGTPAVPPPPKRKADNDLATPAAKSRKTTPVANGSTQAAKPGRPSERESDRNNAATGSRSLQLKPSIDKLSKPSLSSRPPPLSLNGGKYSNASPGQAKRPFPDRGASNSAPGTPGTSGAPKNPPKKGSYAEIMARASAAQEMRGSIGKIQHKAIKKQPSKREREEAAAASKSDMQRAARPPMQSGYTGVAKPGASGQRDRRQDSKPGNGAPRPRFGKAAALAEAEEAARPKAKTNGKAVTSKAPPVEVKRVKKAATATTGYQGTARRRPDPKPAKPGQPASALKNSVRQRDRVPFGGGRRSRYGEEDEDMDDFIDYDEDDDQEEQPVYGYERQYRYAEDDEEDESDMEAGISDIDGEERRAEHYARREDAEQEALEAEHKRSKEDRKKAFYAAQRARKGGH